MAKIETCCICGDPTGKAGRSDDSIYKECVSAFQFTPNPDGPYAMVGEEIGPLCPDCCDRLESLGYVAE
jgi:hypothetical protein